MVSRRTLRSAEKGGRSPWWFPLVSWMKRGIFCFALVLGMQNLCILMPSTNLMDFDPAAMVTTSSSAGSSVDYSLAKHQSLGFFDDITSSTWKRLQKKALAMSPNFCSNELNQDFASFFQCHYEPDFVCIHEERIGIQGDGGKWICDPHRITENVESGGGCLVYSVGSNDDFSFEESVHKNIHQNCEIHTFDFGDFAAGAKAAGINYHKYGLGTDETDSNGNVLKSLSTVIEELGHQNRVIDIFKIDCEGCEWKTVQSWFEAEVKHNVTIRQIQIELHDTNPKDKHKFFDRMYEHGYVIFHKEPNMIAKHKYNANCIEYAFLKLDPKFVNAEQRTKAVDVLEGRAANKK